MAVEDGHIPVTFDRLTPFLVQREEDHLLGSLGTMFPNTALLSPQPRSIAVWHPRGANQTTAKEGCDAKTIQL